MAGPAGESSFLNLNGVSTASGRTLIGSWTEKGPTRSGRDRGEGSSVTYDSGKIIWTGGGNEVLQTGSKPHINWVNKIDNAGPGTKIAEIIDLNKDRTWKTIAPMNFQLRQHNSVVLADGTVMVSGGTQGWGFNDLGPGNPVHTPELWDPAGPGSWQKLAPEDIDRCYHSIVLLLPDGRVLSADGGEYNPTRPQGDENRPNLAKDSHTDAQIFSPPYLFKTGSRPTIFTFTQEIDYGGTIDISLTASDTFYQGKLDPAWFIYA